MHIWSVCDLLMYKIQRQNYRFGRFSNSNISIWLPFGHVLRIHAEFAGNSPRIKDLFGIRSKTCSWLKRHLEMGEKSPSIATPFQALFCFFSVTQTHKRKLNSEFLLFNMHVFLFYYNWNKKLESREIK